VYVTQAYGGFLLYGMDWYKKLTVFYVANTEVLKYVQHHSTKCKKVDKTDMRTSEIRPIVCYLIRF